MSEPSWVKAEHERNIKALARYGESYATEYEKAMPYIDWTGGTGIWDRKTVIVSSLFVMTWILQGVEFHE